jgi:hypothetical protein
MEFERYDEVPAHLASRVVNEAGQAAEVGA